jgi:anhydro-N-acetylmuramic acid kinase
MLAERLPESKILTHDDGDAREAIAFALLASEALLGQKASLPRVTGAQQAALLGAFTFL